jgi:hypothetical protein
VTQSSASTSQSPRNLPVALLDSSMHFCASRRQSSCGYASGHLWCSRLLRLGSYHWTPAAPGSVSQFRNTSAPCWPQCGQVNRDAINESGTESGNASTFATCWCGRRENRATRLANSRGPSPPSRSRSRRLDQTVPYLPPYAGVLVRRQCAGIDGCQRAW